jgi:hypothetical protein
MTYDPTSSGALSYLEAAAEIADRGAGKRSSEHANGAGAVARTASQNPNGAAHAINDGAELAVGTTTGVGPGTTAALAPGGVTGDATSMATRRA